MPKHNPLTQDKLDALFHYLRWCRDNGITHWGFAQKNEEFAPDFLIRKSPAVYQAQTLAELKDAIENFEGCDLKKFAMNTVFARGAEDADIMCVGEAPGADEDRQGKPFVGRSGKLLDLMLEAIDMSADAVRIGNIIPWRPPGNRAPNNIEIEQCLPFIRRHIELVAPRILILLGGVATHALLDSKEGITKLRGRWFDYQSQGLAQPILARPFFHPAYLLRAPNLKKKAWHDLCAIKDKIND